MQQYVTELFLYLVHFMTRNSRAEFVGFLYRIFSQRIKRLLPIPRASLSEIIHHGQKAVKRLQLLLTSSHVIVFLILLS